MSNQARKFEEPLEAELEEFQDLRESIRLRTLKAGVVIFRGNLGTAACTIRDVSKYGARLRFDNTFWLPNKFRLLIESEDIEVGCQVVWRTDNDLGVTFIPLTDDLKPDALSMLQFAR